MEAKQSAGKSHSPHKKQTKFEQLRSVLDEETQKKWDEEQKFLREKLIEEDDFTWRLKDKTLQYIGGVDISFSKTDKNFACSYLVVMSYPDFKVVYKDSEYVHLDAPYIPGFLAFREVPHLMRLVDRLRHTKPEFTPQLILVDGNGVLHSNGFGLASHFGVLADIPTVGCGKTVFYVDGITPEKVRAMCDANLQKGGDFIKLVGKSQRVWGAALKSTATTIDPLIVSVGHRISLDTALQVVTTCCKHRVPEPIRFADIESRVLIRESIKKGISVGKKNNMTFEKDAVNGSEEDEEKNKPKPADDEWRTVSPKK